MCGCVGVVLLLYYRVCVALAQSDLFSNENVRPARPHLMEWGLNTALYLMETLTCITVAGHCTLAHDAAEQPAADSISQNLHCR